MTIENWREGIVCVYECPGDEFVTVKFLLSSVANLKSASSLRQRTRVARPGCYGKGEAASAIDRAECNTI